MSPFLGILRLSLGDLGANALNFLTFLYLARTLGVSAFGVLGFAIATLLYSMLLADCGLELWATRQIALGGDRAQLVARVVPLRLVLAAVTAGLLMLALPLFPEYPYLRPVLALYALTLLAHAVSLKWVLLGQERMGAIAAGVVAAQLVFTVAALASVRAPEDVVRVPLARLAGDLAMSLYCLRAYREGHPPFAGFTLRGWKEALRPATPLGASSALALMSFNIDAILLGFLLGPVAVGLYSAAYRPVLVALAMPLSFFVGLFPILSRTHEESPDEHRRLVGRSLAAAALLAIPLGAGGMMLADPVIHFLFGPSYGDAAPALRVLSWSATLVILRGTYRQAMKAAGRSQLDLACALAATTANLALNILLIPAHGILGAAIATLVSEILWLTLAAGCFDRFLFRVGLLRVLFRPVIAGVLMTGFLALGWPEPWVPRGAASAAVYALVLVLLGEPALRRHLPRRGRAD